MKVGKEIVIKGILEDNKNKVYPFKIKTNDNVFYLDVINNNYNNDYLEDASRQDLIDFVEEHKLFKNAKYIEGDYNVLKTEVLRRDIFKEISSKDISSKDIDTTSIEKDRKILELEKLVSELKLEIFNLKN